MTTIADVLVLTVAGIHAHILVLEMFLWQTRRGRSTARRASRSKA